MTYRIITISRQFGSGGRTIGKEIAERLHYQFYDHELVMKIAERSGLATSFIKDAGEYANSSSRILFPLNNFSSYDQPSLQDDLYVMQCQMIEELAQKSPCVIVGRCADDVLRDRTDCLRVFIHADIDFRVNRIVESYGDKDVSKKRVKDQDKRRSTYYQYYTGHEWGKAEIYDVCLDSSQIGMERCIELIVNMAK